MVDLIKYARTTRMVAVAHAEAFQLMLYTDDKGVGAPLWIWNSRDGVTPFGSTFDGIHYRHAAMKSYRPTYSAVLPTEAQYVWVSYTPETWEAMQRQNYSRFSAVPGTSGAEFCERFPTVERWLEISPFEHGQPRSLTRKQFLEGTPEWMGNAVLHV